MSATLLDVSTLPPFSGPLDEALELATDTSLFLRPALEAWSSGRFISDKLSFGFAVANSNTNWAAHWNEPDQFVWFVGGWGPDRDRYIANAVRKLRPAARLGVDTLEIARHSPELFQDPVDTGADGRFEWGDFPYGGAAFANVAGIRYLAAVSALTQEEDDLVARLIAGFVGFSASLSPADLANRR